ncbi:hypothetical protein MKW94_007518 [Papaver nudicaule]|uniref:Uncharacterized protein n=1 Tax=Papaver nudicaule TaxID=74823 RepID=A0AA41UZF1_PAPNU|nr:hypothetical protein [Papaver nudicaule]
MAETESKSIVVVESSSSNNRGPFSVIQDIIANFLSQVNNMNKKGEEVVVTEVKKVEEIKTKQSPDVVKFPDNRQDLTGLKLTVEEVEPQESGGNNMWQVYALGGFMLLKWGWAKWREAQANKAAKPDSGSEDASPTHDP